MGRNLSKGVFWIVNGSAEEYFFHIMCDINSNIIGKTNYPLCSKDGTNYNHKALWAAQLPKSLTSNKPFDYYPRGRVEIKNAKASVYLNPDINTDEVQKIVIDRFGLNDINGIKVVRFISDGTRHYSYKEFG